MTTLAAAEKAHEKTRAQIRKAQDAVATLEAKLAMARRDLVSAEAAEYLARCKVCRAREESWKA